MNASFATQSFQNVTVGLALMLLMADRCVQGEELRSVQHEKFTGWSTDMIESFPGSGLNISGTGSVTEDIRLQ
jgi:hypothetical protein